MDKPHFYYSRQEAPSHARKVDAYTGSLKELFFVEHSQYKKEMPEAQKELKKYLNQVNIPEIWIYYPWRDVVVKTVAEDIYYKLRTARNRDLITSKEQEKYRNAKVGVIGMSIGSASLEALVRTGGPKKIRIADFDEVEVTNLNRMNANLLEVGSNKAVIAAQRSWEIDPFLEIDVLEDEITKENMDKFIDGNFKLDVAIDAMDSLDMKIMLRLKCRQMGIPLLMATSNGDGTILDVERFDLDKNLPLFHGLIDETDLENISNLSTRNRYGEWLKLATKIVNPKHLSPVMQDSLLKIGKKIAQVPQLGSTVSIAGSAISYLTRLLLNDYNLESGRYLINLDNYFNIKRNFKEDELRSDLESKLGLSNND